MSNKIGNFETDANGDFITTMIIPTTEINERVDFKIKNNQGEEKIMSLRLGNSENRITQLIDNKISIKGINDIFIEETNWKYLEQQHQVLQWLQKLKIQNKW